MAQKKNKRKVTAQTRVKLSQAAKKRQRGAKGTSLAGKFLAGAHGPFEGMIRRSAGRFESVPPPPEGSPGQGRLFNNGETWKSPGGAGEVRDQYARSRGKRAPADRSQGTPIGGQRPTGNRRSKADGGTGIPGTFGTTPSSAKEVAQIARADARRMPKERLEDLHVYNTVRNQGTTDPEEIRRAGARREPSIKVSSRAQQRAKQASREKHWRESGVYTTESKKTPSRFVKEEMSPEHRAEYDKLRQDPNSPFNRGVGQPYNRERMYIEQLQNGLSHDEALAYISQERRGRRPTGRVSDRQATGRRTARAPVRKSKFETAKREPGEKQFGATSGMLESVEQLAERYPNLGKRDLVKLRQEQRHDIYEDLQKNAKWAHETRRSNILGEKGQTDRLGSRKTKEQDDRVVFFTTSLGSPAPSVPADSLIGQYVIKRRKRMMEKAGVPRSQLRGEFPRAVRDMHMFEFSTGLSYGVRGEHGVFKETGWRRGSKASKGYNKPVPLGSHVLIDSQGTPLYDRDGRVMYSEGRTRQFKYDSPRAGLKIFIG